LVRMKQLAQAVFIGKHKLAVSERRLANVALNAMFRPGPPFLVRGRTNEVEHGTPYTVWWTTWGQRAIDRLPRGYRNAAVQRPPPRPRSSGGASDAAKTDITAGLNKGLSHGHPPSIASSTRVMTQTNSPLHGLLMVCSDQLDWHRVMSRKPEHAWMASNGLLVADDQW
jgi:lysozyme family protein